MHRSGNAIDSCVFRGIVANGSSDNYYIAFGGSNSIAEGNRLGTNAARTAVLPNGAFGVTAGFANNLIGGTTAAARNIISTGIADGIDIGGFGSGGTGGFTQNSTITGNTIAANTGHGVYSDNAASLIFQNNFIGTNSSLSQTMDNGGDGMRIIGAFRSNQIGGAGADNTIAFNTDNGINLATALMTLRFGAATAIGIFCVQAADLPVSRGASATTVRLSAITTATAKRT